MARYKTVGELGEVTIIEDEIHNQIKETSWRPVYLNEWTQSSNLQLIAAQNDNQQAAQYEIMSCDYCGERLLRVSGVEYTIKKASVKGDRTVLTVEREISNG
jgi:hypothetical protein